MELIIKKRIIAWTDSFNVFDENGNKKYTVKAALISIGRVFRVYDQYNNEVGTIREKLIKILPCYYIFVGGEKRGYIKKCLSLFHPVYDIQFADLRVDGDIFSWNYDVYNNSGNLVATVRKKIISLVDTYVMDIIDEDYEMEIVMLAVVIEEITVLNGINDDDDDD